MARSSILQDVCQRLRMNVTQGAANAFATAQLATGISTASRYGWLIDSIDFYTNEETLASNVVQTTDCNFNVQIVEGAVPTALITPASEELIAEWNVAFPGIAASVSAMGVQAHHHWDAPDNLVVVSPNIHISVDSTGMANTMQAYAVVNFFPVQINELDMLRLLAQ